MHFSIKLYVGEMVRIEELSGQSLEAIKDIYCARVRGGAVDGLEIFDSSGELVFRYPLSKGDV